MLVLPKSLVPEALGEAHDSLIGGHLGVARTYDRLKNKYYFPVAIEQVARYVATCEQCQFRTGANQKLVPIIVRGPFRRVHIDFRGPLITSSRRKRYIMLAICPMTKYIIANSVPAATALVAAEVLV